MPDETFLLSSATEELNAALAEAEAALREHNPGVYADTPLPDGGFLAWGKMDGKWGLFHASASRPCKGTDTAIPLHNASRLTRIEAARALNALLCALDRATAEQAAEALQAAALARDFAATRRGTKG